MQAVSLSGAGIFCRVPESIAASRPLNLDSKKESTAAWVFLRVAWVDEAQDRLFEGGAVGSAHTWYEVAALLTELLRFHVSARDAQTRGSEGPDGFFLALPG
jgi:hypothetical protein